MNKTEKKTAQDILGMVEEIKKGIVNAVKKYTHPTGIDLFTAMMLATGDFITAYCETTGISKTAAVKRFAQELSSLVNKSDSKEESPKPS